MIGSLAVACGGSPPPTTAPVIAAPPPASAALAGGAPPAPDLSRVPAPDGMAVTLRLTRPKTTAQQIATLLGSGMWAQLLGGAFDAEHLVDEAAGAPLGALVDLDQPVDLAMSDLDSTGDDGPRVAGSAVLLNPETARETISRYFELVPTAPGVVRLKPREDAPDGSSPRPCAMALSVGGATRLICGTEESAVEHLAPYLTRTMPTVTSKADLRLEVFVKTMHVPGLDVFDPGHVGGGDAGDGGAPDPADRMLAELGSKLSDDATSFVVEASTDGSTADVSLTTSFAAAASPLTRALVGAGTPDPAPPAAYLRLPGDASIAWFARGAAAADLSPLRDVFVRYLRTYIAEDGFTPAEITEELEPYERMLLRGGPWVAATGLRLDPARAALDAYVAGGKSTLAARTRARAALQGWVLIGAEEPAAPWLDAVKTIVKIDAKRPSGKPTRKHKPSKGTTSLALAPVPAALQLPAGTLHVAAHTRANPAWLAAQPKSKTPPEPFIEHTTHLFVIADGGRTWFALAEDPALAAAEARVALDPASTATLGAQVSRRDPLAPTARTAGGFVTIAGVATALADADTDTELHKTRAVLTGLASLPSRGDDAIWMGFVASPRPEGAAAGGDVTFRLVAPIDGLARAANASPPIF
jgi:hypothetical protein